MYKFTDIVLETDRKKAHIYNNITCELLIFMHYRILN